EGSGHHPREGIKRSRGGHDVPHHHADPRGPGEVQGPAGHRPNRQRLRQHRHQSGGGAR
uniref:Uncharacterized protein n=1 Tax=Anas zonorhyncha TaxID=75864 RepID=A0A8B9V115_9AVES